MSQNIHALASYLQPFIEKLSMGERAKLSQTIGRDLRKNQSNRITSQKNPDGSGYAPRRKRLREQKGKIRRRMFDKLKNNSNLILRTNADSISLGFVGRVARIANVHQNGLRDRVAPKGATVKYSKRQLLGFTDQDLNQIKESFLKHFDL